ncbi:sensor histidine kinase [Qipengyuania sp. CAU 1752]
MRMWPRNLLGQTLVSVALALLVAQTVSAVLLYRAAENRRTAAILGIAAIALLVDPAFDRAAGAAPLDMRPAGMRRGLGRPLRGEVTRDDPLLPGENIDAGWAEDLSERLNALGLNPAQTVVTVRRATRDPVLQQRLAGNSRRIARLLRADRQILVAAIRFDAASPWQVARVPIPEREPRVLGGIVAQTLVFFFVLMGVLFLLLRRITQPLAALTRRTTQFARTQDLAKPLVPTGPSDISALIAAHNAMESRIATMLDEKDVMLGAIGHDLKTPLAALRLRIEGVENEDRRAKMAAGIEDITRSLDDILSLARVGRADQPAERAELGALVEAVVEEFEQLGEPVSFTSEDKIVRPVHVTWLRRGLRNLVSNALRYGGSAQVTLLHDGDEVVMRVDDDGPGIPAEQIGAMLEPFQRGEASRNRATGGAGIGLTLARAIAEQHGGRLVVANRSQGGLRAEIRLPSTLPEQQSGRAT